MTRAEEVRIWRQIGEGFEKVAACGKPEVVGNYSFGLCRAARASGLPAYWEKGARVSGWEGHDDAGHRALTAYLIAEMVRDGMAPGDEVLT